MQHRLVLILGFSCMLVVVSVSHAVPLQHSNTESVLSSTVSSAPSIEAPSDVSLERNWISFPQSVIGGEVGVVGEMGIASNPLFGAPDAMRFEQMLSRPTNFGTSLNEDYSEDCLDIPLSVCIGNKLLGGAAIYAVDGETKGVIGHWTLDDAAGQDVSGHMNPIRPIQKVGPPRAGLGSSAYFNGVDFAEIDPLPVYNSEIITLSLWVFLIDDLVGAPRVLIQKGGQNQFAPLVNILSGSRKVAVRVVLESDSATPVIESFDSDSSIPLLRWTHVAVTMEGKLITLYINGIHDKQFVLSSKPIKSEGPIYVANNPWDLGLSCFIDDIKIFSRALDSNELEAIGSQAFPGIGSSYAFLGCKSCQLQELDKICQKKSAHICNPLELTNGGYLISRVMGWVQLDQKKLTLWDSTSVNMDGSTATGICCYDV